MGKGASTEHLGMVVATALPPWIVWAVFRRVGRAKTRALGSPPEPAPPVQDLPSADPSLAIAVGWSIALLAALTISVIRELFHPVPTALMMPPARGSRGDTGAPISEWCAYSFHPRAGECEAALAKWSRGPVYYSVEGFSFVGARCLAVADYSLVRPRQAAIDHTPTCSHARSVPARGSFATPRSAASTPTWRCSPHRPTA